MPLQNRVSPFGELFVAPGRGLLFGNRGGRFHTDAKTLTARRWASRQWICCVLDFKGRRRDVWGRFYTELFFLDEPTALAAGHRPCFECRREAAKAFLAAFPNSSGFGADAMDDVLHRERLTDGQKRLWRSPLGALPEGAMIVLEGRAHAVRGGRPAPWSFKGYGEPLTLPTAFEVDVLTPPSTVAALSAGYRPQWAEPVAAPP